MSGASQPVIAIIFAQFAAYHVDRIEAAGARLDGRARVLGLEVASRSKTYAWEEAGALTHAEKLTLFAGQDYEAVPWRTRLGAMQAAAAEADTIFVGLPYSDPSALALMWWARARGKRVIVMSESKADDARRLWWREKAKALVLAPAHGAMVGGLRQAEYFHSLGFADRPVLTGYDTVGTERIRAMAGAGVAVSQERSFLYVGRFVEKKNLSRLLEGYAAYARSAGEGARRLVMAGDGPLADDLHAQAEALGIAANIDWPGFLSAEEVAQTMARALALCLVSTVEQWGLVVNEAAALGVPSIISDNVGARETLVRDGESGVVIDPGSPDAIAGAMARMAASEDQWRELSEAALARSSLGDVFHFADAVETLAGLQAIR